MIRANNQAAVTALVQQLHPPLQKILHLEYVTFALILTIILIKVFLRLLVPFRIYNIMWMSGEIVLGLVYRRMLYALKMDNPNYYLNEKGWLRDGKQKVIAFRYIKFLYLLLNILGLVEVKYFLALRSIPYFCLCLAHIPITLMILLKTKTIQILFQKINRVMNNFDIDYQYEKQEYLNEQSIQQEKFISK